MLRLRLLQLLGSILRPLVRRRPQQPPGCILYIKPDHLGDLLLATPVLAALRAQFPHSRIVALVGPWSRLVLANNPDVDCLLTLPFPGFERTPKRKAQSAKRKTSFSALHSALCALLRPYLTLLRYGLLLRRSDYDLAIIGRDDHWWGALLALVAGIPVRLGFAVPECRPLLSQALPWHRGDHVTAQGLALVAAAVDGQAAESGARVSVDLGSPLPVAYSNFAGWAARANVQFPHAYRFIPGAESRAWAARFLAGSGFDAQRLIVIHPGTGGLSKLWLPEHWAVLADRLRAEGWQLLLTGGPGEETLVAQVTEALSNPVATLVGHTSVDQLAALLEQARAVLGVDSGPLHLAAAVGTPSLHLYGPGDPLRFGPWASSERHSVVRAGLWCSPCGVFAHCPRGYSPAPCMAEIGVEQALLAARLLLSQSLCATVTSDE